MPEKILHQLVELDEPIREEHSNNEQHWTSVYKYECSACHERYQKYLPDNKTCAIEWIREVERVASTFAIQDGDYLMQTLDIMLKQMHWHKNLRELQIANWKRWKENEMSGSRITPGTTTSGYDEIIESGVDPTSVKCPNCGAEKGAPCTRGYGGKPRKCPRTNCERYDCQHSERFHGFRTMQAKHQAKAEQTPAITVACPHCKVAAGLACLKLENGLSHVKREQAAAQGKSEMEQMTRLRLEADDNGIATLTVETTGGGEDGAEDIEVPVIIACPKCGAEQDDHDGFGFRHCEQCGYCTHPSRDGDGHGGMVCGICGDVEPQSTADLMRGLKESLEQARSGALALEYDDGFRDAVAGKDRDPAPRQGEHATAYVMGYDEADSWNAAYTAVCPRCHAGARSVCISDSTGQVRRYPHTERKGEPDMKLSAGVVVKLDTANITEPGLAGIVKASTIVRLAAAPSPVVNVDDHDDPSDDQTMPPYVEQPEPEIPGKLESLKAGPLAVRCDACGAHPGTPCIELNRPTRGGVMIGLFHAARVEASTDPHERWQQDRKDTQAEVQQACGEHWEKCHAEFPDDHTLAWIMATYDATGTVAAGFELARKLGWDRRTYSGWVAQGKEQRKARQATEPAGYTDGTCPKCGATPGEVCRGGDSGRRFPEGHTERRQVVTAAVLQDVPDAQQPIPILGKSDEPFATPEDEQALTRVCPHCHSQPGDVCRDFHGETLPWIHKRRNVDYARKLDDQHAAERKTRRQPKTPHVLSTEPTVDYCPFCRMNGRSTPNVLTGLQIKCKACA